MESCSVARAEEVVRRYLVQVWGERRLDLVDELNGLHVRVHAIAVPSGGLGGGR